MHFLTLSNCSTLASIVWFTGCIIVLLFPAANWPRFIKWNERVRFSALAIMWGIFGIQSPYSFLKISLTIGAFTGAMYCLAKYLKYKDMRGRKFFLVTTKYLELEGDVRSFFGSELYRTGKEKIPYGDEEITFYGEDCGELVSNDGTYKRTLWHFVTDEGRHNFEIASEFNGNSSVHIWDKLIVSQVPMRFDFWKSKLVYTYAPN